MIGYATLGTNDVARAQAFYDALLAEIGAKRLMELPHGFRDPEGNKFCAFRVRPA
jgi:hypothetical protein